MKIRKLFKSGHSTAIAFPRAYMEMMGLRRGDHVYISAVSPEELRIRKAKIVGGEKQINEYVEVGDV
jgi:antitoxin component of MazEF toxin-antitoxin module